MATTKLPVMNQVYEQAMIGQMKCQLKKLPKAIAFTKPIRGYQVVAEMEGKKK